MIEQLDFPDRIEIHKDGVIHRANGPARIWRRSGIASWHLFGKPHRYYGTQNVNGTWWIHGKRIHR